MSTETCIHGHPRSPENTRIYRDKRCCRVCAREYQKQLRLSDPAASRARAKVTRERRLADPARRELEQRRRAEYHQQRHLAQKQLVIDTYGGKCACCGVDDLIYLTIDHIDGSGAEHRRQIGTGRYFHKWLIDNGFPPGFRVLCFNHNFAHAWNACTICEREKAA